jgi:hypothetical protein
VSGLAVWCFPVPMTMHWVSEQAEEEHGLFLLDLQQQVFQREWLSPPPVSVPIMLCSIQYTTIFLMLNKSDVFRAKLEKCPLSNSFHGYKGLCPALAIPPSV